MTSAKRPADISRRNQGIRTRFTAISWTCVVRASDLALGVGDALDQVVAALVGRDLPGQGLLDLDVELVGPREVPGLIDRRADLADIGRLVPDLEDLGHVAPWRPALLHRIAVHHRGVARAQHGVLGEAYSLRVVAVLGLAAEILQELPAPFLVARRRRQEIDVGDADRLALARRAQDLDLAGDRRLRGIVDDVQAIMMVGSAIEVLAGAERLGR